MTLDQSQIEEIKSELILKPLNSAEELRDWMTVYLGITFPLGVVYPESTHGPIEAMWRIYELIKTGESAEIPEVTMLSSRDSYKTLSAAAIEVLLLVHFRFSVAHAAAILSQSEKAVQYVNSFFTKIRPYLEYNGWTKISDNKTRIEWRTDEGDSIYIRILVMTRKGMNSEHLPALFLDEIDLIGDPGALEEAKMVPSMYKGHYPITVSLSTRKYAGGLMEKKIRETIDAGGEILRWNIIDVTERITLEEAKADLPKVVRYVTRTLPMNVLKQEEWEGLIDEEKVKYEKIMAYQGIADHKMLPVMKNYLVDRPQEDVDNLYKPLKAVHNNFKQTSPEMGEAQLLCNKPSSAGLVYPKFNTENILSPREAIERVMGKDMEIDSFPFLAQYLKDLGVKFIGGADWGFSDLTCLVVLAILPNGDIFHLDTFAEDNLELDDIVKYCLELQEFWGIEKWYGDQNYPAYLKTLRKNGMSFPKFDKDVSAGFAAVQGKIVNSDNVRKYYVINTPNNKCVIDAFGTYSWKTDARGDVIEGKAEHGTDGTADIMDSIRYPFQNMFVVNKKINFRMGGSSSKDLQEKINNANSLQSASQEVNKTIMESKIKELAVKDKNNKKKKGKKRIFWT